MKYPTEALAGNRGLFLLSASPTWRSALQRRYTCESRVSPLLLHQYSTTMSSTAKKSFAWIWIAALFTATVGVSVHRIYCYCLDSTSYSLFISPDEECDMGGDDAPAMQCCASKAPVCEEPARSCCDKPGENAPKEHDCTQKTTKVFQLKTEFLVDKPMEKTFDFPLWLNDLPFFVRKVKPALCDASVHFNKAPPPPGPSGWQICINHQIFRC
ncbi:MAG: hypothetical protein JNL02_02615 [Saprospiraceae bacterium]|nr:hypothetical protein [Saprospiraceae bacterium]